MQEGVHRSSLVFSSAWFKNIPLRLLTVHGKEREVGNNVITVAAAQPPSAPPELWRRACQINTVCIDPRVSPTNIIRA